MWELAQVNVARLRADVGSRVVAGFVSALDPVNRLADESPGFVWRLPPLEGHAFSSRPGGDGRDVVNLSVWATYEDLHAFVYRSVHGGFVRRVRGRSGCAGGSRPTAGACARTGPSGRSRCRRSRGCG